MPRLIKQITVSVFFVGLLGTAAWFNLGPVELPFDRVTALKRYGFYFEDVAKQSGVNFTHEAPVLDEKLDHIMPLVAAMGASVSVVDFDHDGWLDIYVVNSAIGSKNHLYRNKGDGTFEDVSDQDGFKSICDVNQQDGVCMGAVGGDYDNDGYEALLI